MISVFPQNIQLFMSDNQGGEDVTQVHCNHQASIVRKSLNYNVFHQIDYLMLLGMPLQTTNMKVLILNTVSLTELLC